MADSAGGKAALISSMAPRWMGKKSSSKNPIPHLQEVITVEETGAVEDSDHLSTQRQRSPPAKWWWWWPKTGSLE
jgi:hypothetical protein